MRRALASNFAESLPFIISVKTDNLGTSNDNQFTLPWNGNYDVEWGDGTSDVGLSTGITHTYNTPGIYVIKITSFAGGEIKFQNGGDKEKLLNINDWGNVVWANLVAAFFGCTNLDVTATGVPNINNLQFMNGMFRDCRSLIGNSSFGQWQLPSNITSLHSLFRNAELFNADISDWDTSSVFNFTHLFSGARSFNQPIGKWNTSNVFSFRNMFKSNDISLPFAFDQSLANWNITSLTQAENMLQGGKLSTTNYDATLISWASQNITNSVTIDFGNSQYTTGGAAEEGRNRLVNTYGWTIVDGGEVVNPDFVFEVIIATDGDTFVLPLESTSNIDVSVDWGDSSVGTITSYDTGSSHTYTTAGTYTVSMSGVIDGWNSFSPDTTGWDATQIGDISNWGTFEMDTDAAFDSCSNLTVSATDTLKIGPVTDQLYAFYACTSLTTIDVSNWDISEVTNLTSMFSNSGLTSIDVSGWNMAEATNLRDVISMFANTQLTSIDLSSWTSTSITNMQSMFKGSPLTGTINLAGLDVSNVTKTFSMFHSVGNTGAIDLSSWDTSSLIDAFGMFKTSSFSSINTTGWNTSGVTNMIEMFNGASSLAEVTDIENWDISALTNATDFMGNVSGISTSVYDAVLENWSAQTVQSNVIIDFGSSQYTLGGAAEAARNTLINTYGWTITDGGASVFTPLNKTELQTAVDLWISNEPQAIIEYGEINTWNVVNITNMSRLFEQKYTFNSDISNWDVSNVTNMEKMFYRASSFNQPINSWNVSNVTNMSHTFDSFGFTSVFNQPLDNWDVSSVTDMSRMFNVSNAFNQPLNSWDVSNVTNMNGLFSESNFDQPLDNWNTSNVTDMTAVFSSTPFNQDISSWDVSSVTDMLGMFYNTASFNQDLSSWSVGNVTVCDYFSLNATSWTLPKPTLTNCTP